MYRFKWYFDIHWFYKFWFYVSLFRRFVLIIYVQENRNLYKTISEFKITFLFLWSLHWRLAHSHIQCLAHPFQVVVPRQFRWNSVGSTVKFTIPTILLGLESWIVCVAHAWVLSFNQEVSLHRGVLVKYLSHFRSYCVLARAGWFSPHNCVRSAKWKFVCCISRRAILCRCKFFGYSVSSLRKQVATSLWVNIRRIVSAWCWHICCHIVKSLKSSPFWWWPITSFWSTTKNRLDYKWQV